MYFDMKKLFLLIFITTYKALKKCKTNMEEGKGED